MADMKIGYEEVLARRKGQPPLPTAVVKNPQVLPPTWLAAARPAL